MKRILYAGLLITASVAQADDSMVVGGGQLGGQNSSYSTIGLITPLPGTTAGSGWVSRIFVEELTYRYKTGTRNIDGTGFGGNASVGYQIASDKGWLGAYAGPSYMHTRLSPNDHESAARGHRFNLRSQLEGEYALTSDFKLNGIGTYAPFESHPYWTRLRTLYRISGNIYMGPEGVYQGDEDYKAWSAGLALVGIPITEKSSLGFNAGVHKTENFNAAAYGGLEFGVSF